MRHICDPSLITHASLIASRDLFALDPGKATEILMDIRKTVGKNTFTKGTLPPAT